jgi:VanZ family protein
MSGAKKRIPHLPFIAFAVWSFLVILLIYLSLQPASRLRPPVVFLHSDKVYHCLYYGMLSLIPRGFLRNKWQHVMTGVFLIILGVLLEFGQGAVPGRYFSFADMFANSAGVAGASLLHFRRS